MTKQKEDEKVICIDVIGVAEELTKGKRYTVIQKEKIMILIHNDQNELGWYSKKFFKKEIGKQPICTYCGGKLEAHWSGLVRCSVCKKDYKKQSETDELDRIILMLMKRDHFKGTDEEILKETKKKIIETVKDCIPEEQENERRKPYDTGYDEGYNQCRIDIEDNINKKLKQEIK